MKINSLLSEITKDRKSVLPEDKIFNEYIKHEDVVFKKRYGYSMKYSLYHTKLIKKTFAYQWYVLRVRWYEMIEEFKKALCFWR